MATDKFDGITVSVELSNESGDSVLRIEEQIAVQGTLAELAGIFHQVHQLAERIRDEQAGLKK